MRASQSDPEVGIAMSLFVACGPPAQAWGPTRLLTHPQPNRVLDLPVTGVDR